MRKHIALLGLVLASIFTFMFIFSKSNNGKLIKVEVIPSDRKIVMVYEDDESIKIFKRAIISAKKEPGKFNYQSLYYKVVLYYPNKTEELYLCINWNINRLNFQYEKDKENIYVISENNSKELEELIFNVRER